jgi:hypothetical protein
MSIIKIAAIYILSLLVSDSAMASNSTLNPGSPPFLLPDTRNNIQVVTLFPSRRSICCQIHSVANQGAVRFGQHFLTDQIDSLIITDRGGDHPLISPPGDQQGGGRKCFYYEDPEVEYTTIRFQLSSLNNINYGNTYGHCTDTTLYGGFNTSVTDFNFIEISNVLKSNSISTGVITGKIVAIDSISDTIIIDREFTIQAGSRTDVDIHSISGPGKFGQVIIYHDGPPGSLQAVSSQYRIVTQNPLDFKPVSQQQFETRGGSY